MLMNGDEMDTTNTTENIERTWRERREKNWNIN